jgi:predicted nucleic acid-binding protein
MPGVRKLFRVEKAPDTPHGLDMRIAAIALRLGNYIVVTADSDLAAVPGLTVENWTS